MMHRVPRDLTLKFLAAWPGLLDAEFADEQGLLATETYDAIRDSLEAERDASGGSSLSLPRKHWLRYHEFYMDLMGGGFATGVFSNCFTELAAIAEAAEAVGENGYSEILKKAIKLTPKDVSTIEQAEAWLDGDDRPEWLDELSDACDEMDDSGSERTLLLYAMAHRDEFFELPASK